MADNGFLLFNDIELSIPPEQIITDRKSVNHFWSTLRTRSSMKMKSGFSSLGCALQRVAFTDTLDPRTGVSGYDKLRHIVSQIRVTPFARIENDHLRTTLMAGDRTSAMAFAVRELRLSKTIEDSNVVYADFILEWFNYAPYLNDFLYKEDIWSPVPVSDPRQSKAWKKMYMAEQRRNNYTKKVTKLDGDLKFSYRQFSQLQIRAYQQLKKDVKALQQLREELTSGMLASDDLEGAITTSLARTLGDADHAAILAEDTFGGYTSMGTNDLKEVIGVINHTLDGNSNSKYDVIINSKSWREVIMKDGKLVSTKDSPIAPRPEKGKEYEPDQLLLIEREHTLDFSGLDLVVQGISISFSHRLATIPMLGHPYPTFQHIGGVDSIIEISAVTTKDESLRQLTGFYSIVEDQAHKFRMIPAGQRNIRISNDILNSICGLHEFMSQSISTSTVPGSPGTTAVALTLVDNSITSNTQEKLSTGQQFITSNDIRRKIAQIIEKDLRLNTDAFKLDTGFFGSGNVEHKPPKVGAVSPIRPFGNVAVSAQNQEIFESKPAPTIYRYTGSTKPEDVVFRKVAEAYAEELGKALVSILSTMQENIGYQVGSKEDLITSIYVLRDTDVLGIEKIQEDIGPLLKKNSKFAAGASGPFTEKGLSTPFIENLKRLDIKRSSAADAANLLNSLRTSLVSPEEKKKLEEQATSTMEGIRTNLQADPRAMVIEVALSDWVDFHIAFLDNITQTKLDLPQFDSINEDLLALTISSASDCYPDFPTDEVVSILEEQGGAPIAQLNEMVKESGIAQKNVAITSLIPPDFYMFTPHVDTLRDLVPGTVINSAVTAIKASQGDKMFETEKNWFETAYKESVIGHERWDKINQLRKDGSNLDKLFWKANTGVDADTGDGPFKPNDLQKEDLPPSIYSLTNNVTKDPGVPLRPIKQGETNDRWSTASKSDDLQRLTPGPLSGSCQHRFGLDALETLPEGRYQPNPSSDPSKNPIFKWPTDESCRVVTSPFGERSKPRPGASSNHKGLDIAAPGGSLGKAVYSTASGHIEEVSFSATEAREKVKYGNEGVRIIVDHGNGWKSKYFHLKWDSVIQEFSDIRWKRGKYQNLSPASQKEKLKVDNSTRIGSIGNTGHGTGPHLHFEVWYAGAATDPRAAIAGDFNKSQGPIVGIDPQNESVLTKSVDQMTKDLSSGQGGGLIRAYPTFKLYFIESDLGERKHFAFDDFFSYSSVADISVIRSRKIASDLCVITLTNTSGILTNRKFQNKADPDKPKDKFGKSQSEDEKNRNKTNTVNENPLASIMVQSGTQVQLRLGYSNNPEDLETVFNGVITDVEYGEGDNIITIVCQTYAIELTQTIQGDIKDFGGWFSNSGRTGRIIEELLAAPEVVHFGRWDAGAQTGENKSRGLLRTDWRRKPTPQDDNVFAPAGKGLLGIFDFTDKYIMYKSNFWEVFQEMTLRHPSYIAAAVPYAAVEGPRMTLFFGVPDQLYFARDPSPKESTVAESIGEFIKGDMDKFDPRAKQLEKIMDGSLTLRESIEQTLADDKSGKAKLSDDQRKAWLKKILKTLAQDKGVIRPFRGYHLLTSSLHIVKNEIVSSANTTFNTITVQYSDEDPEVDSDMDELKFGDQDTFTLVADAGIPDEDKREGFGAFQNCLGNEMAQRYALGMLWRSMKDGYRGTITILGNPKIKPYDICYVFDEYTDMFGPIEVEQVIHHFGENGFVTEITPDMLVHVNQASTMASSDAMGLVAEHAMRSIGMPSLGDIMAKNPWAGVTLGALNAVNHSVAPLAAMFFNSTENTIGASGDSTFTGLVGTFIWRKLCTRTQLAHPLRYSPLVVHGQPMPGGVPIKKVPTGFIQSMGNWFKDTSEAFPLAIGDWYDTVNPNNWFSNTQGSALDTILGRTR